MAADAPESPKRAPPAAVRNAEPITEVLTRVFTNRLAEGETVLEIAAGSGYHAASFAKAMPQFNWQPTDPSAEARVSIAAYASEPGLPNLKTPLELDVRTHPWPIATIGAVLCINMIHISPWEATLALFKGAGERLAAGKPLVTYGPYSLDGDFIAESNIAFDQSLKARDPSWGIRDVRDVAKAAAEQGFSHDETVTMPANNMMLVFSKTA